VRTNLAGHTCLHKVVFNREFLDGRDQWWLAQHGLLVVVSAKENMAVTINARAQAAAGERVTVGRRNTGASTTAGTSKRTSSTQ
jgi:hypothetical protein